MSKAQSEHGTTSSYVIGFALSLIFTVIPYYLVVNKVITGTSLLYTILGFAFLQMIIQVVFFLHIGRGPKPNWNLFFFISTVMIVLIVVGGSIIIINNLHYNMSPEEKIKRLVNNEGIYQVNGVQTGACQQLYDNHQIIIKDGLPSPAFIEAKKCDTLTFINQDDGEREVTFGPHPQHGVYAGVEELSVKKGRGKSITLSETGTYQFHDHLQPEMAGAFTVNE